MGNSEWSDRVTGGESSVTWSRLTFLLLCLFVYAFTNKKNSISQTKQKTNKGDKPV